MTTLPYLDATTSPEQRADDLLARLTLEEKAGQLSQYFYFGTGEEPDAAALASRSPALIPSQRNGSGSQRRERWLTHGSAVRSVRRPVSVGSCWATAASARPS